MKKIIVAALVIAALCALAWGLVLVSALERMS